MRKFLINVNGTSYEVEVEEIGGANSAPVISNVVPSIPTVTPETKSANQNAVEATPKSTIPSTETPVGSLKITAPMPGTILKVNFQPGSVIKKNDVLFILEAMKMENEIMAPRDGKIAVIAVSAGDLVNPGDLLAAIE